MLSFQPLTSGEYQILLASKLEKEGTKFVNFVWCKI